MILKGLDFIALEPTGLQRRLGLIALETPKPLNPQLQGLHRVLIGLGRVARGQETGDLEPLMRASTSKSPIIGHPLGNGSRMST